MCVTITPERKREGEVEGIKSAISWLMQLQLSTRKLTTVVTATQKSRGSSTRANSSVRYRFIKKNLLSPLPSSSITKAVTYLTHWFVTLIRTVCEGISTDHRRRKRRRWLSTRLLFLHSCHLSSLPGCWRTLWYPSFQTSWQWFHSWVSPWQQQSSVCFQSAARTRKHLMLFITSFYCFGPKATNCREKDKEW